MGTYQMKNRKTEGAMQAAYIAALSRKESHEITVMDICQGAGIHRSTFYRHYSGLAELISQTENELLQKIEASASDFEELDIRRAKSNRDPILQSAYIYAVIFSENRERILALLSPNAGSHFRNAFREIIRQAFITGFHGEKPYGEYNEMIQDALAEIVVSETCKWLHQESMTPLEAARFSVAFLETAIR